MNKKQSKNKSKLTKIWLFISSAIGIFILTQISDKLIPYFIDKKQEEEEAIIEQKEKERLAFIRDSIRRDSIALAKNSLEKKLKEIRLELKDRLAIYTKIKPSAISISDAKRIKSDFMGDIPVYERFEKVNILSLLEDLTNSSLEALEKERNEKLAQLITENRRLLLRLADYTYPITNHGKVLKRNAESFEVEGYDNGKAVISKYTYLKDGTEVKLKEGEEVSHQVIVLNSMQKAKIQNVCKEVGVYLNDN